MKYEVVEKIVKNGESKTFENWKIISGVSENDFLDGLRWICGDPENGGNDRRHMTREVGLTPTGVKKLDRVYGDYGVRFYEKDTGKPWNGEIFMVPCDNPAYAEGDGKVSLMFKISLNTRDRILRGTDMVNIYEFCKTCMEDGLTPEEAAREYWDAVEEHKRDFMERYENDPLVNEGRRQQDVIELYRRER